MPSYRDKPEYTVLDLLDHGYWWNNRGLVMLNLICLIPIMTSITQGLDSSLLNGLVILPEYKNTFGDQGPQIQGFIVAAQFIGNLVGLPFSPYVSDYFGRRAALFIGALVMLAGVSIMTTAQNIPMLIGSRAILGFGMSFCSNAAPLLLIELAYPTHRGKMTSIFNSCWYFGSVISAWVCYAALGHATNSWQWRIPTMAQAFLPIIQVVSIWFIPESPRWLVSRGREGRAAQILAKYHANGGDERDPLVVFEMAQIRHAIRAEEIVNSSNSYLALFKGRGNRRRTMLLIAIAVFSQWSGNGLGSYYLSIVLESIGISDVKRVSRINGGLQIYNFCIAMGASFVIDWVGRRSLFIISNAGMLLSFAAWTITTALCEQGNKAAGFAAVPLIFVFYFFYDIAYTPLIVTYSLEILPFKIRAKGFALMNFTIMATVSFNQFVNPWALNALKWKYYLVYCGWLVFELVFVILFIVETKGRTLEETAAIFDGSDQEKDLAAAGGSAAGKSIRVRMFHDDRLVDRLVYPSMGTPRKRSEGGISVPTTPNNIEVFTNVEVFELSDTGRKKRPDSHSSSSSRGDGPTYMAI